MTKLFEEEQKDVAWLEDFTHANVHDAPDTPAISAAHTRHLHALALRSRLQSRNVPNRLHNPVSPLLDRSFAFMARRFDH